MAFFDELKQGLADVVTLGASYQARKTAEAQRRAERQARRRERMQALADRQAMVAERQAVLAERATTTVETPEDETEDVGFGQLMGPRLDMGAASGLPIPVGR
jgi:hypothetical protein